LDGVTRQDDTVLPSGALKGDRHFQRQFIQFRQAQQPNWLNRFRFDRFYKLAVNTRLAQDIQSFQLKIGGEIKVLPEKDTIS
jgi:hypothetical protein